MSADDLIRRIAENAQELVAHVEFDHRVRAVDRINNGQDLAIGVPDHPPKLTLGRTAAYNQWLSMTWLMVSLRLGGTPRRPDMACSLSSGPYASFPRWRGGRTAGPS